MKQKLRRIVIDGSPYLWRFTPGYRKTDSEQITGCADEFVAFLEGRKTSPLRIYFDTWECSMIGGPLRTGAPFDFQDPTGPGVNLRHPANAKILIRGGLRRGWEPEREKAAFEILDGIGFLRGLLKELESASDLPES